MKSIITKVLPMLMWALFCASAWSDFEVNTRVDKVLLKNGLTIECIVLMITSKGVLIVESDPKDAEKTHQRFISTDIVDKIIRGEADGSITNFQTQEELPHIKEQTLIKGSGGHQEQSHFKKDGRKSETAVPLTPSGKLEPAGKATRSPTTIGEIGKFNPKELAAAYFSRFPLLKTTAQNFLGLDRAPQLLEQAQKGDTLMRKQIENFLKLFLPTSDGALNQKSVVAHKIKPVKSSRSEMQPKANEP